MVAFATEAVPDMIQYIKHTTLVMMHSDVHNFGKIILAAVEKSRGV